MTPSRLYYMYNMRYLPQQLRDLINNFLGEKPATRRQMRKFLAKYPKYRGVNW